MRLTAVIDVEVGVEERGALRTQEGRLRFDPLANDSQRTPVVASRSIFGVLISLPR